MEEERSDLISICHKKRSLSVNGANNKKKTGRCFQPDTFLRCQLIKTTFMKTFSSSSSFVASLERKRKNRREKEEEKSTLKSIRYV